MNFLRNIPGFSSELEKLALIKTELQPHQQRVVDKIQKSDQPGLVVAHGLGSGKTLTSIAAQEALNLPSDVVVPASLQDNYSKEIKKHVRGESPERNIRSMQNVASKKTPLTNPVLVVDEAHRARDSSTQTYKTLAKTKAEKRLLLSGSPFYNHPSDIAPLINIAAGDNILPNNPQDFEKRYINQAVVRPGLIGQIRGMKAGIVPKLNSSREQELRRHFAKWVDYHPSSQEDFPSVTKETVEVPMTPEQIGVYDTLMNAAPPWVAYKIRKGLPPSKAEAQQLNSFLGGIRQVSNTSSPFQPDEDPQEPKINKAFENLQEYLKNNPKARAVVYSNYLQAGVSPYKKRLEEAGIPFGEYTGEIKKSIRDDLVRKYNEDKLKVLLLSSSGGEGLDLKGTRLMQILEPHWNSEKIRQVEGRGVRFKSHSHLPKEDQNVLIQHYLATRPRHGLLEKLKLKSPGGSVDQYLTQRSKEKDELIDQFRALLPKNLPPKKENLNDSPSQ